MAPLYHKLPVALNERPLRRLVIILVVNWRLSARQLKAPVHTLYRSFTENGVPRSNDLFVVRLVGPNWMLAVNGFSPHTSTGNTAVRHWILRKRSSLRSSKALKRRSAEVMRAPVPTAQLLTQNSF
jgi:hypothetical protein